MLGDSLQRLFGVKGKVALVTGGTSGLGRYVAEALAAAGARVYIVARDAPKCGRVAAEMSNVGNVKPLPGDISTLEGIQRVADEFCAAEARLDILINNAGVLEQAPVDEYGEALWDKALDLNLKAPFFLCKALLPALRAAATEDDPARIVNVSSGHGIRVSPFDHFGYSASKAGLNHLTRVLAQKLAGEHITVNAVAPGLFMTALTADFAPEKIERSRAGIPLGRLGSADDIAGSILYLVSKAGSYTTSVVLPVDGGWAGIA